ncbi:MAG: hypothetical protein D6729_04005 [Deltaproteobacteria bacterium]|nr:MAG: hypothetical protein D6729_04005 [Deltaproteobacteria bacterium]
MPRLSRSARLAGARACLLLLAVGAAPLGCRDPHAGPPPRALSPAQRQQVRENTLSSMPTPLFRPPVEPVTLGGGAVRYLGFDAAPLPARRGEPLHIVHYWKAERPLERDWKVFVHAGESGSILDGDHHPVGGLWPTSRWRPGEIYRDAHTVRVPAAWPQATLPLYVGLYRYDDRLPVDQRQAQDGKNRIRAGAVPLSGGALPVPEYRAPRTYEVMQIDGKLSEAAWGSAPVARLVRSDGRGRPTRRTEAKLLWDDARLYVAFVAEDPDVFSTFEADDDPLYEQEVVEIFIDADGNGRTYNELQVAPSGHIFDASFVAPRQGMDLGWSSGMEAAVEVDGTLNDASDTDRGWTVEIAIPFDRLTAVPHRPPQAGEVWRFNLYRLEHLDRKRVEGQSLSPPVLPDFHRPERFARLRFVDEGGSRGHAAARGAAGATTP